MWVSRREARETGIGQARVTMSLCQPTRIREDGQRVHISPVRDHNELMFQVFPSFLEIICGAHTQEVGGQEIGHSIGGPDNHISLLTSSVPWTTPLPSLDIDFPMFGRKELDLWMPENLCNLPVKYVKDSPLSS